MKDVIKTLKDEFPNKTIDISESLELLKETINDTMDSISVELKLAYSKRDFTRVRLFTKLGEEINQYEQKLEQIIELLEIEDPIENREDLEPEGKKTVNSPDYSIYYVDPNIEHTLYENFTYKRPFGFRISNQEIIEVKTWQEMLIKICEILIAVDENKFMSFEHNPNMNGKKRKYFSKNDKGMNKPKLIGDKIFIETNISANSIRNLVLKLLKEYGSKSSEFKVYLRADYTEMHR
ncbi:hypothetical protein [Tuberibacillus calidus]|uniref:hypothetical protein n=1 Tax=Tuberibacillus calidus TaxID=340097 RepID=UPI001FDF541D|nr:hypothetical protein [Tuberibacillus calidus]